MADVQRDIEELEQKVAQQEAKANRSITVSLIVTAVIVVVLLSYFAIMASQVRSLLNPQDVAGMASEEVKARIPELSAELQSTARERAPELVDRGIDNLIENQMPKWRERAQQEIKQEVTVAFEKYETEFQAKFDAVLEQQEGFVKRAVNQLSMEGEQVYFEEDLFDRINEVIEGNEELQREMAMYAEALRDIVLKLEVLEMPSSILNKEEQAMKNVLAIVMTLLNRSELNTLDLGTPDPS